jgi:ABC-type multidrug transport system ATPase subunit
MRQRFGIAQALLGRPRLLIVDEPTAGLDPEERNRFHHLLAELGDDAVVLLSTHIVEDVASVCSAMAIMGRGKLLLGGQPREVSAALAGSLWQKVIPRGQAIAAKPLHTRPDPGGVLVIVQAAVAPGADWAPKVPDLEDAYHHALASAGGTP